MFRDLTAIADKLFEKFAEIEGKSPNVLLLGLQAEEEFRDCLNREKSIVRSDGFSKFEEVQFGENETLAGTQWRGCRVVIVKHVPEMLRFAREADAENGKKTLGI